MQNCCDYLTIRRGGQYGREKSIALKELAASSIGFSDPAPTFELKQNVCLTRYLQEEIHRLDGDIESLVEEINSPIMTIPGVSYTLTAIILAEIGDIHGFSTPGKVQAFAGLDPSTYESGKYNAFHATMVKRGSTYLR